MSKRNAQSNTNRKPWLHLLLLFTVVAFFLFTPYSRGLFFGTQISFEKPIYIAILLASLMMIVGSFSFFEKKKMNTHLLLSIGLVCLLPAIYLISSFNAVSSHSAGDAIFVAWLWAVFFILSVIIHRNSQINERLIVNSLIVSSYILVFVGFLNWFGHLEFKDAVLQGRLSNVFQYPNTYAVYLMGVFFAQIFIVTNEKLRYRWFLVHALMVVPVLLSILLTLSRGAMIIIPVLTILFLLLYSIKVQLKFVLYSIISFAISIPLMSLLLYIRYNDINVYLGWGSVLAASLLNGFIIWLIKKSKLNFAGKLSVPRYLNNRWILPLSLALIVIILGMLVATKSPVFKILPDELQTRILSIDLNDSSSYQRLTYYHDSWELAKDYAIIGAGGGSWAKLYTHYQSYPYIGNQAHSFYMQLLNETGFTGLFILLSLLFIVYYAHIRKQLKTFDYRHVYFLIATPILVHSAIDFHMSFVYIDALVFYCLGGMLASSEISGERNNKLKANHFAPHIALGILLAIVSIFVIYTMTRNIEADSKYKKAMEIGNYSYLKNAMEIRPNHPEYANLAIRSLLQEYINTNNRKLYDEAWGLIEKQRKLEPYNTNVLYLQAQALMMNNKPDEAVQLLNSYLNDNPWNIAVHEHLVDILFELGLSDPKWGDFAIEHYEKYQMKFEETKTKYDSGILLELDIKVANIYFHTARYQDVTAVLRKHMISSRMSLQEYRQAFRLVLAAAMKLGSKNEQLYNSFTGLYPDEIGEIEKLVGDPNPS